jgi:hypothetical protein
MYRQCAMANFARQQTFLLPLAIAKSSTASDGSEPVIACPIAPHSRPRSLNALIEDFSVGLIDSARVL